jgi:hypothetical protein
MLMVCSDDDTRVVLKTNDKYKHDYINANYVSVSMHVRMYSLKNMLSKQSRMDYQLLCICRCPVPTTGRRTLPHKVHRRIQLMTFGE